MTDKLRPETTSEHIARDMREGRFPEQSERQMVAVDEPGKPADVTAALDGVGALVAEYRARVETFDGLTAIMGELRTERGKPIRGLHQMTADKLEALAAALAEQTARAEAAEARVAELTAKMEAQGKALVDHNDLLRSALQIAKREGVEGLTASTNWDAYYNRVAGALKRHHDTTNAASALAAQEGGE